MSDWEEYICERCGGLFWSRGVAASCSACRDLMGQPTAIQWHKKPKKQQEKKEKKPVEPVAAPATNESGRLWE